MVKREKKTLEQALKEEKEIWTVASGDSMLPCIRPQKDILHLVYPTAHIQKYDVILYRRTNGSYILHRVMEVRDTEYVLCGDNQYILELGITDKQILGVLRGFYRGEHYIDCHTNRKYCFYVRVWSYSLRLRKTFIRIMNFLKSVRRHLTFAV